MEVGGKARKRKVEEKNETGRGRKGEERREKQNWKGNVRRGKRKGEKEEKARKARVKRE